VKRRLTWQNNCLKKSRGKRPLPLVGKNRDQRK
jgi:hypothetical protein